MSPPTTPLAIAGLGLRAATPPTWAAHVCRDLPALLDDHAHLERKAASNALALLNRWPDRVRGAPDARRDWVRSLSGIAADEARHLAQVLTELERVGGAFSAGHTNAYAAMLRAQVRIGDGRHELLDRLLVSGLIEARSCERFRLLAAGATLPRLRRFYEALARSEAGHHHAFARLAAYAVDEEEVVQRRRALQEIEAQVVQAQPAGPWLHSWID